MPESFSEILEQGLIDSAWIRPDTQVVETPKIYKIVNPALALAFANRIYRTRFDVEECERKIRFHRDEYHRQDISFRWYVFAHSQPADLGRRLDQLGASSVMDMQGLIIERANFPRDIPSGVTIEELSLKNLEDYALAGREGWGRTNVQGEQIKQGMKRDLQAGQLGYRAFLARYHGEPAAVGALRFVKGLGYLFGGSCRPSFRGRGIYRSLVIHRLAFVQGAGIDRAFALARTASSAPVCRKLGFEVACECRSYDFVAASRKACASDA